MRRLRKFVLLWLFSSFVMLRPAYAEVLWQDFRLTYLNGSHYRLGDPERQVLTIEHAAATSWGDSFFFLDHMKSNNGQHSNYAELQPRFSLG